VREHAREGGGRKRSTIALLLGTTEAQRKQSHYGRRFMAEALCISETRGPDKIQRYTLTVSRRVRVSRVNLNLASGGIRPLSDQLVGQTGVET
jgi:hypothetical protein